MENTTAKTFVDAFDPMNKTHVLWLKKMNKAMDQLDMNKRMNLDELVAQNPMGKNMPNSLDWVFIHFGLAMAYTKAVLDCKAWLPPPAKNN